MVLWIRSESIILISALSDRFSLTGHACCNDFGRAAPKSPHRGGEELSTASRHRAPPTLLVVTATVRR